MTLKVFDLPLFTWEIVTGFEVTSPFALNDSAPRMLRASLMRKSCFVTSEREPFDCAIAATRASAACAAYTEYGSGGRLSALVKFLTNDLPAPFSALFGR